MYVRITEHDKEPLGLKMTGNSLSV